VATVLIGFMGSGKSTAARELAARMQSVASDSDELLEARLGHTVAEEFEGKGEAAFRELEEQLVLELLERAEPDSVISLGGGSVLASSVQEALRQHLVVLMEIDASGAWERLRGPGMDRRPLARDRDAFFALHREREALYESLADAILPARATSVALRALPALRALRLAPAGTKMIWAGAASGEYPVLVGEGLIAGRAEDERASAEASGWWPLPRERSRAFCVSDENVAPLYGRGVGPIAARVQIEPGETQKTLASVERVMRALAAAQMTRADHLIALGGGVVGDLAGFCASAYQRGVPVIQVPTTLVAQVDSAYGGKTGVDLPEGKNYVGAYHQPSGVVVDPKTLATLPRRELAAGWVEVMKTAMIAGGSLWARVEAAVAKATGPPRVDVETILACARTKLGIVAADERDAGPRQALNLGHTIGHAIETASGYERFLHGEAVGLGLLGALRLSDAGELRAELQEMLTAIGLPTRLEGVEAEQVIAATSQDKKRLGEGPVPFVLARAPGEVEIGVEVTEAELRGAVTELCS
jgi:shikimate kinase / 3-dehydroquinate synthase